MLLAHNEQLWQSARKWSDRMRLRGCSWCSSCWTGRTCTSRCRWSWWWCWTYAFTWGSFKRETSTLTLYRVPDGIDPMLTCLETHIYQVDVNHLLASVLHQKMFSSLGWYCGHGCLSRSNNCRQWKICWTTTRALPTLQPSCQSGSSLDFNCVWQMAKPQGFRDDPRFLTSRDKAYKRVVNDTSIFKLDLPSTRLAQSTRGRDGGWPIVENARFYLSFRTGLGSKTTPESKCPELLANYCDMLLRKTPLSKVSIW